MSIWVITMATWKGLSSSLMVQIVTHLSMKKVTKFEEKIFPRFWEMLKKPLGGGGRIPPPPSRNRVNRVPVWTTFDGFKKTTQHIILMPCPNVLYTYSMAIYALQHL